MGLHQQVGDGPSSADVPSAGWPGWAPLLLPPILCSRCISSWGALGPPVWVECPQFGYVLLSVSRRRSWVPSSAITARVAVMFSAQRRTDSDIGWPDSPFNPSATPIPFHPSLTHVRDTSLLAPLFSLVFLNSRGNWSAVCQWQPSCPCALGELSTAAGLGPRLGLGPQACVSWSVGFALCF